ncbi:MAG: penicillin acylase family protein, partial [Acetobacteraceae bacterium]
AHPVRRRRATGRAAEFLGAAAFEQDALSRRLGVERASRRDYEAAAPETRAMLDRYAAGVNALIDSATPRPVEYALLDAVPERWEGWQSIAVMRRLGLLMGSVWFKLWRAAALPVVGAEQVGKLRYDDGGLDALIIPPGVEAKRWEATLAELAPSVAALLEAAAPDAAGGGSNNWVLGPGRSDTGRPVLAGDPHRVFEIPNMYAQHHIACNAFDAIGLTVPGVPAFPHFAHNGKVAWCVTHAFMDLFDLFVERFDAGAAHYRFRGAWHPTTRREEEIAVRGEAPRRIAVIETHHGAVIAGDPARGTALTLRTVQTAETDFSFDCLPRLLRAGSVEELYEATRGWGLIDHNLVAADTAGHIGQLVRATMPRRPRANGWLPVPGWTGEHEWEGWIPFEAMPRVIDPPGGVIVTANNRVVADDHPDYLCTDCHPPYRAQRIAALIELGASGTAAGAAVIHADVLSPHAALLRERLAALPEPTGPAAALRDMLLAWDGQMAEGSTAAEGYNALRRALTAVLAERSGLAALAGHPYLSVAPGIVPQNQLWWCLPTLLRNDDAALLGGWNWDQALGEALDRAAGPRQLWGRVHQPRFSHPLSALFPGAGLDPASLPLPGDGDTVQAIGLLPSAGPAATYGALARYAFDVGDWDKSLWAVFHGVSGRPGSPHYADQNGLWSGCRMAPMRYSWALIAEEATATQILDPGEPA